MKNIDPVSTLSDIKSMMEKSSRFISLSGLSGVAAGIVGLLSSALVYYLYPEGIIDDNYSQSQIKFDDAKSTIILIATGTLILALLLAAFFTVRKSKKLGLSIWDSSTKRLLINMAIPLVTGGLFILGLLRIQNSSILIAPSCLIFYGLALLNASKYTLGEIRQLGLLEIMLGLTNMVFLGKGLFFWTLGFGVAHVIYGWYMWNKYDRN